MLALLLLPILSWGQKEKPSKAVKGYGEASYTLSASEQYMSTWLVAGPVPVSAEPNPSGEVQKKFFSEDIPAVAVLTKKVVAPLQINGK